MRFRATHGASNPRHRLGTQGAPKNVATLTLFLGGERGSTKTSNKNEPLDWEVGQSNSAQPTLFMSVRYRHASRSASRVTKTRRCCHESHMTRLSTQAPGPHEQSEGSRPGFGRCWRCPQFCQLHRGATSDDSRAKSALSTAESDWHREGRRRHIRAEK